MSVDVGFVGVQLGFLQLLLTQTWVKCTSLDFSRCVVYSGIRFITISAASKKLEQDEKSGLTRFVFKFLYLHYCINLFLIFLWTIGLCSPVPYHKMLLAVITESTPRIKCPNGKYSNDRTWELMMKIILYIIFSFNYILLRPWSFLQLTFHSYKLCWKSLTFNYDSHFWLVFSWLASHVFVASAT